jgi:hypothetical protein
MVQVLIARRRFLARLAGASALCNYSSEEVAKFRGFIAMPRTTKMEAAPKLVRQRWVIRPCDLAAHNIPADPRPA